MNKTLKIFIFIILGVVISIGTGTLMFYKNMNVSNDTKSISENKNTPTKKEENIDKKNILFVGDADGLSDTIFVASFDSNKKEVKMLSIPRDTYYPRPGYNNPGEKKINAAYSEQKIDGLKKSVEDLLGIRIDNYVILSYKGFKDIIDTIGGVEINVPFNMKYDDTVAKPPLHINLKKGLQILDGEKALQYVRYRHGYTEGDIGRINAQQEFIKAFIKKVTTPSILPRIPSLAVTLSRNLKTDLSLSDITKYAIAFAKNKPEKIDTAIIPGEGRYQDNVSYYYVDSQKAMEIASSMFGENTNGEASQTVSQMTYSISNNAIKVEVLNGTKISGLATKYADELKKLGFNVIKIGNISGIDYTDSRVYIRNDAEKANKVAKALSINYVENDKNNNSNIDVTVVIGEDKK